MNSLDIVLAQKNPCVGDIAANIDEAIAAVRKNRTSDLVVFAECFATGYPVEDLVLRPSFIATVAKELARFVAAVVEINGPAVVIGAPVAGPGLPYNAAIFVKPDSTTTVVTKYDRPNDGVFDEVRNFAQGALRGPIRWRGVNVGLGICEEMWHDRVARHLAGEGSDILIFINGSPYRREVMDLRMAHARRRVRETGLPLVYVNQVGGQDELVFDGASFVLDADGTLIARLPAFREDVRTVRFPFVSHSIDAYPQGREADYLAAVLGLRDYVDKSGFKGVVLGMSGGIDSALATAIAVDALGHDRVQVVTMPWKVTAEDSVGDAYAAAEAVGVRCDSLPIDAVFAGVTSVLGAHPLFGAEPKDITGQNIQARIRMVLLMAMTNQCGTMLVTTGNKSEMSVGYATSYGDMAGGYNAIKDFYKTEVWALAAFRNGRRPAGCLGRDGVVIPVAIIDKAPSAGLAAGQTDEATLGPYVVLDALLRGIVDEDLDAQSALREAGRELEGKLAADLAAKYLVPAHASFVARLVANAEYKRRQAAPGTKIGKRAFGRDRRYPIVNRFPFDRTGA
jgi:NAD+ synthase